MPFNYVNIMLKHSIASYHSLNDEFLIRNVEDSLILMTNDYTKQLFLEVNIMSSIAVVVKRFGAADRQHVYIIRLFLVPGPV